MHRSVVHLFVLGLVLFVGGEGLAKADPYVLNDLNSSVAVNTQDASLPRVGIYSWVVDGIPNLFQEWFWYRIGSGPSSSEANIGELAISSIVYATEIADDDPANDVLVVTYTSPGVFRLKLTIDLDGDLAGSGISILDERILVTNLSAAPLDFHLFEYTDFDLGGDAAGDMVTLLFNNTVEQKEPGKLVLNETVVTPTPQHHQLDLAPVIFNSLEDGSPTTLNDNPGVGTTIGPGNTTWAFQWDKVLNPFNTAGSTLDVHKFKNMGPTVPEPAGILLLGTVLILLARTMNRRLRRTS